RGPRVVSSTGTAIEPETTLDVPTHIEHVAETAPAPVVPTTGKPGGLKWPRLALLLLASAALLMYLFGRARPPRITDIGSQGASLAKNAIAKITLPGGVSLSVPQGSINYDLARYLGDTSATVPKMFVFDHLNFESATTQLTPGSAQTVNDLAQVLKAYPNAQVQLVGHTDNTGTPAANQTLSLERANTVRALLVGQGVGAD